MDDFISHTGIKWNGNVGTVEYGGGDSKMVVFFYNKPRHNPAKSRDEGTPIYEDTVFVKIHPPGERLNIVDRPATVQDQRRFPVQWMQFKENREQIPDGTPIDLLYPDQPSIAATLRAFGVHTVEQCSELSGVAIDEIGMGAQRYNNDARKYIEMANKGVTASQMRHEIEQRDSEIRTLKNTVAQLQEQVQRLSENSAGAVDLVQIQRMLASMQQRPTYPNPKQIDQAFDSQTAQINATHTTADISRAKRTRSRIKS